MVAEHGVSERRACKLLEIDRSSYRYEPRSDDDAAIREELVALARQKPRFGYRRLGVLLERRGYSVNHKRLYRMYREEHLAVRRLKRKHVTRPAAALANLSNANQEWSMDFVADGLATGRALRIFTLVDSFTRACLALEVDSCFQAVAYASAGLGDRAAWRTDNDPLRQRPGIHEPTLSDVGRRAADPDHLHSAGPADAERLRRELQRPIPGRMPERELVCNDERRTTEGRIVANRLQRRPAAQLVGLRAPSEFAADLRKATA